MPLGALARPRKRELQDGGRGKRDKADAESEAERDDGNGRERAQGAGLIEPELAARGQTGVRLVPELGLNVV